MNFIKKIIPVGIATFIVLVAAGTMLTSADEADNNQPPEKPRFNAELHAEYQEALETGDYEAWAAIISQKKAGSKILEVINEENFDRYVEMHNHLKAAKEISAELGLPSHPGRGKWHSKTGMMRGKKEGFRHR